MTRQKRQEKRITEARLERDAQRWEVVAEEICWTIRGADPNEIDQPQAEYPEAEFD
jgi:hypothetical protein